MLKTIFLTRIQDAKHTNWKEVDVSKNTELNFRPVF